MFNTNIMGLKCKNPVVVSAGPWTRGVEKIKQAFESGAAAVVTESIVSEAYPDIVPRYAYEKSTKGVQNIRLYSAWNLEKWLEELKILSNANRYGYDARLIMSIMGGSASEVAYIARKVEKAGADGVEIGIACPMGEGLEIIAGKEDAVYDYTKEVVESLDIPVSVKLNSGVNNLNNIIEAIESAGAIGVTGIDTVRCILNVDIEKGEATLPTYGGYSGAPIKPIALSTVAAIYQSTNLPILGVGGITDHISLVEHIMVGASAGGIGTEILLNGYDVIPKILSDLEKWVIEHEIKNIEEIRGCAVKKLKSFEELKVEPQKARLKSNCNDVTCDQCVKCCLEKAIVIKDNEKIIDDNKCTACGLCIPVCPENKISLKWM